MVGMTVLRTFAELMQVNAVEIAASPAAPRNDRLGMRRYRNPVLPHGAELVGGSGWVSGKPCSRVLEHGTRLLWV